MVNTKPAPKPLWPWRPPAAVGTAVPPWAPLRPPWAPLAWRVPRQIAWRRWPVPTSAHWVAKWAPDAPPAPGGASQWLRAERDSDGALVAVVLEWDGGPFSDGLAVGSPTGK